MTRSTGDADHGFGFQIAPMLDVLFVLLLFFMVCAGTQKRETVFSIPLPNGPSGQVPVRLEIAAEGQVTFNGAPVDQPNDERLPQTIMRLRAVVADSPTRPILISPSAQTRQQRVIDVVNACTAAGIRNLAFTTPLD